MNVDTWDNIIIIIFFIYGLAFYSLGLAMLVESERSSELLFARSMRLMAGFGLLHGTHEWLDMLERINIGLACAVLPEWILWLRLSFLITSFAALAAFGENMFIRDLYPDKHGFQWTITLSLLLFFAISAIGVWSVYRMDDNQWRVAMDVLARYILGIPGASLTSYALWRQYKLFVKDGMEDLAGSLRWAALALLLYGAVGQMFPASSVIFPANIINNDLFMHVFGFPVQLLRAALAVVIAVAMIRVLRALEVESQNRIYTIEEARITGELKKKSELEYLNVELRAAHEETRHLLQHITLAQENERKRIARELHDDTGQVLTGLSLGLRGLSNIIQTKPEVAVQYVQDLQKMASNGIFDLRSLIQDLRPPQLDDMGLVAALRNMQERFNGINETRTELCIIGEPVPLPGEIETTLFRIAQEGVTNALKHAEARSIVVTINYGADLLLIIRDDGKGFDPNEVLSQAASRTSWGLLGVQERCRLINADPHIDSVPGHGTTLSVRLNRGIRNDN